jgi:hypothetical protein
MLKGSEDPVNPLISPDFQGIISPINADPFTSPTSVDPFHFSKIRRDTGYRDAGFRRRLQITDLRLEENQCTAIFGLSERQIMVFRSNMSFNGASPA